MTTRTRIRIGVVGLLVVVGLVLGVGIYRSVATPQAAAASVTQEDADLADLSSDAAQQDLQARLASDIAAITANPDQAGNGAAVTAACQLVTEITQPLPVAQSQWITANCVDPNDTARPGEYAGAGGGR